MNQVKLLLLPGMDGTGRLFHWFRQVIPPHIQVQVASYPCDQALGYAELLDRLRDDVADGSVVIVAESFSGPLAIGLADERPDCVLGLVLCASFVRPPVWRWLCLLASRLARVLRPSARALRYALLGRAAPGPVTRALADATGSILPAVRAERLRSIAHVDCAAALARTTTPLLYLRAKHDRLVGAGSLRRILTARPDTQVATIAAPHLLLQSAPEEAWREIERFIARLTSPPSPVS